MSGPSAWRSARFCSGWSTGSSPPRSGALGRPGCGSASTADLAVGVVPDGADAWADQASMVAGASVGAPPDPLGPLGQNWNVVAPAPAALAATDAARCARPCGR